MGGASFTDPNTMALLGAMQGLGQAAAPSRLPVTNGMVFGQLAGGLMGGGQQALQNQLVGQEVLSKGTQTAQAFPMLQLLYSGLGLKPPSIQDIKQGKLQGLESLLQGMQTPTTPTAPASASPAMASTGAAPAAPAAQLAMANPGTSAGVERTDADRAPSTNPTAWPFSNLPVSAAPVAGAPTTGQVASVLGAPLPETTSGSLPGAPFPTRAAPAPPATTLAQASPGTGAPVVAGGIMANPIANAMFRRMITGTLTPVDQAMLSAQISPPGSVQQQLNSALAAKAGGYTPFVGGERPGVPGRVLSFDAQGRPQWNIAFQNPRTPEGALIGPNGEVAMAPGATQAIGAEAAARGYGEAGPKIYTGMMTPHTVGPETSIVVPGMSAGQPVAAPSVTPGAPAPSGVAPAAATPGLPAATAPGVLRQGINPIYQKATEGQISSDQDRIAKDLQGQADKANDTMATSKLIGDLLPRVATGWSAETKAEIGRVMKAFGVSDSGVQSVLSMNPTATDALQKQFLAQTAQAVRVMGAREPGSVISMFSKAYPNLETQPGAIKLLENVLYMQGQRQHDEFTMAQAQHQQAVAATATGQPYMPLTRFTADFNNGIHNSINYLRGAQAMAGDPAAWQGLAAPQIDQVVSLIPSGTVFTSPDGVRRIHP